MTGLEYLLISQFFVCVMLSLVFYVVWKTIARKAYVLCFCIIYVLGIVAGFFNVAVGSLPSHAWYWVLYALVFQIILGLLLFAVRLRAGKRRLAPWHWVLLVGTQLAVMWYSLVQPHVGMQMALVPFCACWILLLSAQQIWQSNAQPRLSEKWASVFMMLYAVALVGSSFTAIMQGADYDPYYLEWYNRFTFLVQPTAFSGAGIFVVLMLADDLAVRMRDLATTDQLTELLNRRGFEKAAKGILSYTRRNDEPLTVVIADMDKFKKINDQFSHRAGDLALQCFARNACTVLRKEDIIARIGGEEFAILLVGTPLSQGREIVERLREKIEQTPIRLKQGELFVTCSFGLVGLESRHQDIFAALSEADEALYEAKHAGRNQCKVYSAPGESLPLNLQS